jgi:hypothetical protein
MSPSSRKAYRIELLGKQRGDGSWLVTSPNLGPLSALLREANWDHVFPYVGKFLEVNFGEVCEIRLIRDASELMGHDLPPGYLIVELEPTRASPH